MRQAEEPLTRIALHIFTSDYECLRKRSEWTVELRYLIRQYVRNQKRKEASLSQVSLIPRGDE